MRSPKNKTRRALRSAEPNDSSVTQGAASSDAAPVSFWSLLRNPTAVAPIFEPIADLLTTIAPVLAPIPYVFVTITTIFAPVPNVFESVAQATIMAGVAYIFAAVSTVLTPVKSIFTPIEHLLTSVANILATIADVFDPIAYATPRRLAVSWERNSNYEYRCADGKEQFG